MTPDADFNPVFPVMHAPHMATWRVTFDDREWHFKTSEEAVAFCAGWNASRYESDGGVQQP